MSYNTQHCLNFLTQKIDFDLIANTIKNCGADIIGLQEIRGEGPREDYVDQIKVLSEKTGFYYYFAEAIKVDDTNPYGNAILSKYPITSAETITIPDPEVKKYKDGYETRCILKAKRVHKSIVKTIIFKKTFVFGLLIFALPFFIFIQLLYRCSCRLR